MLKVIKTVAYATKSKKLTNQTCPFALCVINKNITLLHQ